MSKGVVAGLPGHGGSLVERDQELGLLVVDKKLNGSSGTHEGLCT